MNEQIQKLKHILHRQKTWLFHSSALAQWVKSKIWVSPAPGVVTILYRQAQDISHYFDWNELDDQVAREKLRSFTTRYANEPDVVYEVKGDLLIEPGHGLAINGNRQYIPESGTLSHIYLKPSLLSHLWHRYIVRKYTRVDQLIHCDGFAGMNLCHFIYDTLNPIFFMYQKGMITKQDQILIGEKVYQKPYFQYFLSRTFMGELNWLRQTDNQWIKTRQFRKAFVSMEIFPSTYTLFPATYRPHRRIFLNRRAKFQRNIKNQEAIAAVLEKFGFEMVYAEDLSYEQQVALFRDVKYFVGIHGAGLTNLLHSSIPDLRVLEIFSENYVHASFYRFLKILKVGYYDAIAGTALDINWSFSLDPREFEVKVNKLIQTQPV